MASDAATRTTLEAVLPDYEIQGELGRGAMGVVVAARHRSLDRQVAIKELPSSFAADVDIRQRFLREAQTLASLNHPHVVQVFDFVDRQGHLALVMERLPGGTVWRRFTSKGLTAPAACGLILAASAGLDHAHCAGVLHRDVKPENLMFTAQGWLKVTDFGIAKVMGGERTLATMEGAILGTPAYMAPEQAEGLPVGPSADVYACGTVLYEMLCGLLPFALAATPMATLIARIRDDAPPLATRATHIAPAIAEVVDRALARQVADRYPTVEEFAVALGQAAAGTWGTNWLAATGVAVAGAEAIEWALRTPRPVGGGTLGFSATDLEAEVADGRFLRPVAPAPATVLDHERSPAAIDLSRVRPSEMYDISEVGRRRPGGSWLVAVAFTALAVALASVGPGLLTPDRSGRLPIDFSQPFPFPGADGGSELTMELSALGVPMGRVHGTVSPENLTIDPGYLRWTAAGVLDAVVEIDGGPSQELVVVATQPWSTTAPNIALVVGTLFGLATASSHRKGLARRGGTRVGPMLGLAGAGAVLGFAAAGFAWAGADVALLPEVLGGCAGLGAAAGLSFGQATRSRRKASRR